MLFIDKRYFSYFDWISLICMLLLATIGLFFVYSATYKPDQPYSLFFNKQLIGMITGLGVYCICCCIDYRIFQRWCYAGYFLLIGILFFTLIKGSIGMGAQRWINLGFAKFQPSELAKCMFPACFLYYAQLNQQISYTKLFAPMLGLLFLSSGLIMKQPDLGTAILVAASGLTIFWLSGLRTSFFLYFFLTLALAAPLIWHNLRPYQKQRILVLLGEGEKYGNRYHIEQSIIAIGSGGITGKGFLQGTQNKFQFLPESRTDFIFSVICEEWGFFGALLVLFLYCFLFLRIMSVIISIKNVAVQLLATGLIIHLMIAVVVNIGMVIGLLPIVGIPLPFLSYGITHLWIGFASLGCYNSIASRRFYLSNTL